MRHITYKRRTNGITFHKNPLRVDAPCNKNIAHGSGKTDDELALIAKTNKITAPPAGKRVELEKKLEKGDD